MLWEEMYEEAKRYYEQHGHLMSVPATLKGPRGRGLFAWIMAQQSGYRNGKNGKRLSSEQVMKLQAIGMDWELRTDRHFDRGIKTLLEYKKEHNDMLIPVGYRSPDGYQLGKWASRQRKLKKESKLLPDREQYLNKQGFIWDYTEHYWNRMYECATKYYQEHGNFEVPPNYIGSNGEKLWQWKMDMRKRYKESKVTLSQNQIEKLERIGMDWEGKKDAFAECMNSVREYKKRHGVQIIPKHYVTEDGVELGNQIRYIMHRKCMGILSEEQLEIFEAECEGLYVDIKGNWWKNYEEVRAYYEEHGDINVPKGTISKAGIQLDVWVSNHSRYVKQGKISRYTEAQLEALKLIGI